MNSVSYDIAQRLAAANIGTVASTSDWGIFIDMMPDQPTNCIAVFETQGLPPIHDSGETTNPFERAFFQVRIRGDDYDTVFSKALAISNNLTSARFTVKETLASDVHYRGLVRQGTIFPVASEVKGVYIRTVNFLAFRQEDVA